MFGVDWLTGPLLGAGLGALAGGSSGGGGESRSTQLDPRMANYIYGPNGQGGLLDDAQSIYKQQMQNGGLNDMQRQGMGMQYQYLTSPQYTQGAQSLYDMGAGLLSGGVAGNPFNRQQQRPQGPQQGVQRPGFQFAPTQASIPTYKPEQRQQGAPTGGAQVGGLMGAPGQGGGIQRGSGGMSNDGGQGISADTTQAALQAMALSENPAIRALSPSIAALLGLGGYAVAGQQADAMGAAGNHLAASQPLANLGIGTISDADGNVRTISNPAMVAAADASMFGDAGNPNTPSTAFGGGWGVRGTGGGWGGGYGGGIGQSGGNASGMGSHQA